MIHYKIRKGTPVVFWKACSNIYSVDKSAPAISALTPIDIHLSMWNRVYYSPRMMYTVAPPSGSIPIKFMLFVLGDLYLIPRVPSHYNRISVEASFVVVTNDAL